jgi:hypothetical protein
MSASARTELRRDCSSSQISAVARVALSKKTNVATANRVFFRNVPRSCDLDSDESEIVLIGLMGN